MRAAYDDLDLVVEFDQGLPQRHDEDADAVGQIDPLATCQDNAHLKNPQCMASILSIYTLGGCTQPIIRTSPQEI